MRRTALAFFALFTSLFLLRPALAQDAFTVEVIRDAQMQRDQLFDSALLWLAESTVSSKAVIDLQDKSLGTIIGTASTDLKIGWGATAPMSFKLRMDFKDNKYRMTFSQVNLLLNGPLQPIESTNRTSMEPKAREELERLAAAFQAYLATAPKSQAW